MIHIEEMLVFKDKYIDRIVDIKDDGNYNYRDVLALLGKREKNRTFVRQYFIKE